MNSSVINRNYTMRLNGDFYWADEGVSTASSCFSFQSSIEKFETSTSASRLWVCG